MILETLDTPRPATPLSLALAACRAIIFCGKQAGRHRGEYSLPDLAAAEFLAHAALTLAQSTDTKPLLTGKLTNAGAVMVFDEIIDGVFIAIDREQIRALPQLPMYQQIELRVAAMQEGAK